MRHHTRQHLARLELDMLPARHRYPNRKGLLIFFALVALLVLGPTIEHKAASADTPRYIVYLPFATAQTQTVFGLDATSLTPERSADIAALGATWVRGHNLLWRDVEPAQGGGYRWDAPSVQVIEQEMLNASQHNLRPILIVRSSPAWATAPYKADCAPINPANYARFAMFLAAAVERYSKPPYNVMYWEIGNEPDAQIFPSDSGFGCWGITDDPYYGGRAYGAMLSVVYPAMKAKAPQISVLNGGLLLDHPYNPADESGRIARFIEGVFLAGAGYSFDILSFHSYSYYDGRVDGTRGAADWKVSYLRDLMRKYGIPQKPVINTEAALLCVTFTQGCQQAQADAIGRYYTRALDDGLLGHLWYIYDSDGFNNTALVEPSDISVQRPSYQAYKNAASLLGNARLLGPLTGQGSDVEGYRFSTVGQIITIFWSNTGQTAVIPVQPGSVVTCIDRDGGSIMCDNIEGAVTLTAQSGPTYVVELR